MCHTLHCIVIFAFIVLNCEALTCRSEGGPKENELKSIYMTCLKKQEGKNTSDSHGYTEDQDLKETRGQSKFHPKTKWNSGSMGDIDDRIRDRDDRDDRSNRDDRSRNRDDRMGDRNDRMGGREEMFGRDRAGGRDNMNGRNNMMDKNEDMNRFGREPYGDRQGFPQSDEYDSEMIRYGQHSTTQSSRRFKRSRRTEINSGQRSQYNPNTRKTSQYEETFKNDDKNSSNSSREIDNKACALHCFMEQLEMTGDNGMPDRYLVTHAITKDVKNEDLRDFLQESIEECFQILDNENSEDKCEFSKNLMMCLSEKGRANCDDWKDDLQF
ncbi:general odorant-binding protein 71 [Ostrinia nubilalis]|uniref:general odorant-binding protein 71 n=1 Tax=Ostrinia nubilalis TaxID=29057 RepID=UPI0030822440